MSSRLSPLVWTLAAAGCAALGGNAPSADRPAAADLPARPDDLTFEPLSFEPPKAADYRHVLPCGVPVYLAPSHEFPLAAVNFSFQGGAYLEPQDKVGLAGMTGAMMRRGGTTSKSADELDEEFDFLAANCSSFSGSTQSGASLNCLTSNFEEALALFLDMVRHPGFQEDKLEIYRDQRLERMKQRNDDAGSILNREWDFLVYGEEHFEGRVSTQASLESITVDDLKAFHRRVFQPGNLIISATGDFEVEEMLVRLEKALEGWPAGEKMPPPPAPTQELTPGVFRVEKDIPQGKVYIGQRSVTRDHPDAIALTLMNDILGGGGFTSRITSRVRSDEGLAYSAGSGYSMPVYYPGTFVASFQSKNRTVALAIKVILEEIARIREQRVTPEELETAKNALIETFPRTFESKGNTLGVFVSDEWTARPADYWQTYRERVRAVTPEDVLRVAKEHLDPAKLAIFVVGKWEEIGPGDLDGRARMAEFGGGIATELPLRDPLTMEPMVP